MKKFVIMSILSVVLGFLSCNAQSKGYKSVDAKSFAKIIKDTAVVRLDVRTPEEYAEGHIEKAINIDVMNNNFETTAMSILPQNKTIALYCRSGNRSKKAAGILAEKGYKVVELNSGYKGWNAFKEQR